MPVKTKPKTFYQRHNQLLASLAIFLFVFLFLTRDLASTALHPWDEAWYAEIAKNITRSGDFFNLHYNTNIYWDHPPLGFYSLALSFSLLGVSEFAARLPMAIFASLAVVFAYLAASRVTNRPLGLASALILLSTRWFLFRAQTGNLDALLIATQIAVFYFSYQLESSKRLYLLWFSFALSLLSKSAISLTLSPLVLLATLQFFRAHRPSLQTLVFAFYSFVLPLAPWYLYNYIIYGDKFIDRNIFYIGLRSGSAAGVSLETVKTTLVFLHSAIHKWYQPLLTSAAVAPLFIKSRQVRWLLLYLFLTAFPYFVSAQTQIWHLIPVAAPASLLIPLVIYHLFRAAAKYHPQTLPLVNRATLFIVAAISLLIWKDLSKEHYSGISFDSPAVVLAKAAAAYREPLYLESLKDFSTTIVFYSNHYQIDLNPYNPNEKNAINTVALPYLLITSPNFVANNLDLFDYQILASAQAQVMARFPPAASFQTVLQYGVFYRHHSVYCT